jgi:aspartyl aminopeptidase
MKYGGALWRTWFDRDLTLAGKIIVKEKGKLVSKLWNAKKPIICMPSLCIHLESATEREAFKPNIETHCKPIIASSIVDALFGPGVKALKDDSFNIDKNHWNIFTDRIAKDLGISRESIVNFEINLADTQMANFTGFHEEFISSPRLDNLASSIAALDAIVEHHKKPASQRNHAEVDMIMLFDHEEIGS